MKSQFLSIRLLMGKVYTFINNGKVNTKVKTEDLDKYLASGWKIGNWNQEELNKRSGEGVSRFYNKLKSDGSWSEWNSCKAQKITTGLKAFWSTADEEYKERREQRKQDTVSSWSDEMREYVHNKMSESAKANRLTISSEEYHRRSLLSNKTKKDNGTFNTSSYETICYKALCESYGEEDIIREYDTDYRYKFKCDFYIKSMDLFIELNIHPSHWEHRFDCNNPEDLAVLEDLKTSNTDWSKMIVDVWANRDFKKCKCAKEAGINYITIYYKEFDSFIKKVKDKKL